MILNKKLWTRLYIGIFFLVITGLLHNLRVKVHSFSAKTKNGTKIILTRNVSSIEILISSIANVSAMEPPVAISEKCHPADLPPVGEISCSQHPGLSGD